MNIDLKTVAIVGVGVLVAKAIKPLIILALIICIPLIVIGWIGQQFGCIPNSKDEVVSNKKVSKKRQIVKVDKKITKVAKVVKSIKKVKRIRVVDIDAWADDPYAKDI
jgi:hypothetical protein